MVNVINFFLIANTLLSNLLNFICSLITLIGLTSQKTEVRGFKATVAHMATVNFIFAVGTLLTFPIFLYPPGTPTYLLGQYYPDALLLFLVVSDQVLLRVSMWVLGLIFIYRTLVVIRPLMDMKVFMGISSTVAFAVPLLQAILLQDYSTKNIQTCDYWCLDQIFENHTESGIWKRVVYLENGDISEVIDTLVMIAVTVTGLKCRKKLHKFFKNGTYSEKTIRLQKQLNKGMLIMIIIHLASLYPFAVRAVVSFLLNFAGVNDARANNISDVSLLLSDVFFQSWQMPALSVVMFMSVRGFIRLKKKTKPISSTETTVVRIFQQVKKNVHLPTFAK